MRNNSVEPHGTVIEHYVPRNEVLLPKKLWIETTKFAKNFNREKHRPLQYNYYSTTLLDDYFINRHHSSKNVTSALGQCALTSSARLAWQSGRRPWPCSPPRGPALERGCSAEPPPSPCAPSASSPAAPPSDHAPPESQGGGGGEMQVGGHWS